MDDDERDFREFVTTRWSALVGTAFLITTDRGIAEDCVQEALTRVHRRWGALRREGNPGAYVHRSVVNAALSWKRRRRIREVPLAGVMHPADPGAQQAQDAAGGWDPQLLAALRSLPPRMRAVVVLRYLEDRSETETAALLGCSAGTVKSAASRGLTKLRAAVGPPSAAPPDPRIPRAGLPRTTPEGAL